MNGNPNREYGLHPSSNMEEGTFLNQHSDLFEQDENGLKEYEPESVKNTPLDEKR